MKKPVIYLKPLEPEHLRLNFGYDKSAELSVAALHEMFKPTLYHFEKFAIGRFFWFIIDLTNWKHLLGGGAIEVLTPLKMSDFINGDHQKLHDVTHPDDLPHIMAFSKFWVNYHPDLVPEKRPYVKMTLYFRILNADHKYYWIMVQYADYILDQDNKFTSGLVLVTDISHIKKEGHPMMSILDTSDGSCQQFFCYDQNNLTNQKTLHHLTDREIEVLRYLSIGYSSKQIASQLKISVKTVDNHRQNMLHKTLTKSSAELVNHCIYMGYL